MDKLCHFAENCGVEVDKLQPIVIKHVNLEDQVTLSTIDQSVLPTSLINLLNERCTIRTYSFLGQHIQEAKVSKTLFLDLFQHYQPHWTWMVIWHVDLYWAANLVEGLKSLRHQAAEWQQLRATTSILVNSQAKFCFPAFDLLQCPSSNEECFLSNLLLASKIGS